MKAGRELDALIAEKVMGDRLIKRGKWRGYWDCGRGMHYSDEDGGPLHYSTDIAAAWRVVEKLHGGINPADVGAYQYLTLTCVGAYHDRWAASFDFNLSHDWYDADVLPMCPFAARDATPMLAICLAALKACDVEIES